MATVLVVDDDTDLLEVIAILFDDAGIRCLPAHSLADVEAYGTRVLACTLALLDVNLGRGQPSGIDTSNYLRKMNFEGRIVFITGHAQDHPLVQQALGPADRVLSKPINAKALLELAAA
jgi:DNA-binding response OmpR family regulator